MTVFEISKHEFESRFGEGLLYSSDLKIYLINSSMAIVRHLNGELESFGDTNIEEEEEFKLLSLLSPSFTREFKIEDSRCEIEKNYKKEGLKYSITSLAPVYIFLTLVVVIFICFLIYVN